MTLSPVSIPPDTPAGIDARGAGAAEVILLGPNDGWLELAHNVPETHNIALLHTREPARLNTLTETRPMLESMLVRKLVKRFEGSQGHA